MHMTIQQILREKGLSRYQLSKRSGIPWATLADICSGKTALTRCSAGTLGKLSAALDIPMEELLTMTVEQRLAPDGKPKDRSYLEKDLPASLQKALDEYIQGEKDHVSYMDCLWGELYGATPGRRRERRVICDISILGYCAMWRQNMPSGLPAAFGREIPFPAPIAGLIFC